MIAAFYSIIFLNLKTADWSIVTFSIIYIIFFFWLRHI